jgi:hypothetical protein
MFPESFVIPLATIPGCIGYRVENLPVDNGNTLSMTDLSAILPEYCKYL